MWHTSANESTVIIAPKAEVKQPQTTDTAPPEGRTTPSLCGSVSLWRGGRDATTHAAALK